MKEKLRYAKDEKCDCGKPAVVFVGLADPDATRIPKCRKCADMWRIELIIKLGELDEKRKRKKKKK